MAHLSSYTNQTLMNKYQNWDQANPNFYPLFVRFATALAVKGFKRISAKLVFERLRWESMISTTGEEYKLNNNYTAIYARRFMDDYPQYGDLFKLRTIN